MTNKITTQRINPPIPNRSWDWLATYTDQNEDSPQGWGTTEAEAIEDLKINYPLDDSTQTIKKLCAALTESFIVIESLIYASNDGTFCMNAWDNMERAECAAKKFIKEANPLIAGQ